ncbi:MAG TPA: hypothetical protein VLI72_03480 [Methylibium sp.]|nr:hypothetical protein [Methylibium sp.]
MFADIVNSIKATLYDRTSSPLFGSFAVSWAAWNYKLVAVLLGDGKFQEKLEFVNITLYPDGWKSIAWLWGLGPIVTAVLFILIYPWPARWVYEYAAAQQRRLRDVRRRIEGDELISAEEARQLRQSHAALEIEFDVKLRAIQQERDSLRELAANVTEERDVQRKLVATLTNERTELEASVARRSNERARSTAGEPPAPVARITGDSHERAQDVMRTPGHPGEEGLSDTAWRLTFDPKRPSGSKIIHLQAGGKVGEGRNDNEHSWQLTDDGLLQFIQGNGSPHSRFALDRTAGRWISKKRDGLGQKTTEQYLAPDAGRAL